jgi:hypothetical protein
MQFARVVMMVLAAGGCCCAFAVAAEPPAAPTPASMPASAPAPEAIKTSYLGVVTVPVDTNTARQLDLPAGTGLRVIFVEAASPAQLAGVTVKDVLLKWDEQILINTQQLSVLVRTSKPQQEVALTVVRQGKQTVLKAKLVEKELPRVPQVQVIRPTAGTAPADGPKASDMDTGVLHITKIIVSMKDGVHVLDLVVSKEGKRLIAKDAKNQQVLFEGPVNTPQQRQPVPSNLLAKLEKLEQDRKAVIEKAKSLNLNVLMSSTTQPAGK